MRYLCLRNCFVDSQYWHKGGEYELPDEMNKNEKNFSLVPETIPDAPETIISPVEEAEVIPIPKKPIKRRKRIKKKQ